MQRRHSAGDQDEEGPMEAFRETKPSLAWMFAETLLLSIRNQST